MSISIRAYRDPEDYAVVDRFLVELYEPDDTLANWLQPRWEYMHGHSNVDDVDLGSIGIAETTDGTVLGVVHPEHSPTSCYLQLRADHAGVKPMLVDWAENHMGGWSQSLGRNILGFYVEDTDTELQAIVGERGFVASPEWGEHHARMRLDGPLPEPSLPDGFRLQSLAEDNDLAKVNRVLWRGFNHEGPPPDDVIPSRARAQQTPNYRPDLNVVAVAPDGSYASYAGIWFVPENLVAYVEPVATDPDYRRMGLGKAAVLETLRRAKGLGANIAWVGSDQEFYVDMGFEVMAHSTLWYRYLDG